METNRSENDILLNCPTIAYRAHTKLPPKTKWFALKIVSQENKQHFKNIHLGLGTTTLVGVFIVIFYYDFDFDCLLQHYYHHLHHHRFTTTYYRLLLSLSNHVYNANGMNHVSEPVDLRDQQCCPMHAEIHKQTHTHTRTHKREENTTEWIDSVFNAERLNQIANIFGLFGAHDNNIFLYCLYY